VSPIDLNWLDGRLLRLQGPDRPWSIMLRAHFVKPQSVLAVERAWSIVAAARPELSSVLAEPLVWEPAATGGQVVLGPVEPYLDRPARPGRDRVVCVVADADPASSISIVVNHAFTDGIGCRWIVNDVLLALAGEVVATRTPVTSEHLDGLRSRGLAVTGALGQIPWRRPLVLGADPGATTEMATNSVSLDVIGSRRREEGVSLNGLVVAAVTDAIASISQPSRRAVVIGVPADLRRHVGGPTGIGNAVVNLSLAIPNRSAAQHVDRFIERRATRHHLGAALAWYRRAARPGPPRLLQRSGRSVATAMVSNIGLVATGDHWTNVSAIDFAPPAHQTTSIGVVGYGDQLSVTVRSRSTGVAEPLAHAARDRLLG